MLTLWIYQRGVALLSKCILSRCALNTYFKSWSLSDPKVKKAQSIGDGTKMTRKPKKEYKPPQLKVGQQLLLTNNIDTLINVVNGSTIHPGTKLEIIDSLVTLGSLYHLDEKSATTTTTIISPL